MSEKWMQKAFSKNPGKLHRALGVKEGEKIPAGKIAEARKSEKPGMRKMVALAKTGAKFGGGRKSKRSPSRSGGR